MNNPDEFIQRVMITVLFEKKNDLKFTGMWSKEKVKFLMSKSRYIALTLFMC